MTRALVLGVGNILVQDMGIGIRTLEWLHARYASPGVEMVDGRIMAMGLDLLPYLEKVDHLLILDTIEAGRAPGEIVELSGEDVITFTWAKVSPHQVAVQDLLSVAQFLECLPSEVVVMGVQPAWRRAGLEMSPPVARQVESLARRVLYRLETWGYQVEPI